MQLSFLTPFRIVFIFLIISVLGVFALPLLPVELNPKPESNTLQIRYQYPQAAPDIVENLATAPLENALSQLQGLKKISSVSRYNGGNITLSFEKGQNMELKKFETTMILRQIYPKLPPSVSYPQLQLTDANAQSHKKASLSYSVNAPLTAFEIEEQVRKIASLHFSKITQIEEISVRGTSDLAIEVRYLPEKMLQYGISHQDLVSRLQELAQIDYIGQSKDGVGQNFWVKKRPLLTESSENKATFSKNFTKIVENLLLSENPLVRFSDVATFAVVENAPSGFYRINGKEAVTLSFYLQKDANALEAGRKIKAAIAQMPLPTDFELLLEWDETDFLEKELEKTYRRALFSLLILIFFIVLLQRNLLYLCVLISSLFVNLCLTALFAYFFKIQIHLYSLAGVAISFGLILDNALVMVDSLHQKRSGSLFLALLGASLTTAAALLLVFFLPEETRRNLTDFAAIVALNLLLSLPVALFFTPALYHLLFQTKKEKKKKTNFRFGRRFSVQVFQKYLLFIAFLKSHKKKFMIALLLLFGTPIFLLPSKVENPKNSKILVWYNDIIGSDLYQNDIRPHIDTYLGGTLRLFVRFGYERFSYREAEKARLYVQAEMPQGTTLQQMDSALRSIELILKAEKNIEKFVTQVITSSGQIEILFPKEVENSSYPLQLKNRLIARSVDLDGVKWNIYGVGNQAFSNSNEAQLASFRVQMKGTHYQNLEAEAEKLAALLVKHKRIQQVNTNERLSYEERARKTLAWEVDLEKLAHQGLSAQTLTAALRLHTPSSEAEFYLPYQNSLLPVRLESRDSKSFAAQELKSGYLSVFQLDSATKINTKTVAFQDFSTLKIENSSSSIYKENRLYLRIVGFDYYGGANFGQKFLDQTLEQYKSQMPQGYEVKQLENNFFSWEKAKTEYGLLLILVVIIFFICSILFENFRQALLIIFTIPFSFIGIFITFGGLEVYFDQGGYASFVLLGGLVVNAAIFILDEYNFLKKRSRKKAIFLKAIYKKSYPILLTVISTFLGLLPFLWEGQEEVFWFSLAAGVTGGLFFSLFCVFVVLPVMADEIRVKSLKIKH
ncbi:efflux RND transporter permease subunit [Hugenholtzia roseola]|uniref:efflux RND transporter permease subunit n=1 Tax=Hugenholtzia roseola TaxID=1002 RepID=UPI0004022202|nr:efflux RND transporter permease subunit [Hugenholtzia roseola]